MLSPDLDQSHQDWNREEVLPDRANVLGDQLRQRQAVGPIIRRPAINRVDDRLVAP
jgi:hypothetical protein